MDFESGLEIARNGARSNPDDPGILNNLAYCLLELGKISEAESTLARAKSDPNKPGLEPALKATRGLLAFRKGDLAEGRRLYLEAVDKARALGSRPSAARAAYHLAYEELLANSPRSEDSIARMKEFKDQQGIAELDGFSERVTTLLKGRGRDPTPVSRNEP
jgi:tetratricopeptide (TPR) repeat protein